MINTMWYNSLWLWRWLTHGLSKSQSLSTTTFLFSACTVTQWKIKMKTIQYRRTRIWEMKKDNYTKTLAKNKVCEIFQMRDIGENGLPKFIKLCMETPCWCPFQEHQYGRRTPTENICFRVFLLMREFFAWGTHKDYSNIYSETRNV